MEAISSVDAEVSSSEAACWDAPAASDWLEDDTMDAPPETLSALSLMRAARFLSASPTRRTIHKTPAPTPSAISRSTDRKSTRLNSSHLGISYAVFCLKKKKTQLMSAQQSTRSRSIYLHFLYRCN